MRKGETLDLDNREWKVVEHLIAHTRQSVFLTGKAGTGKSTFLRHITATTDKSYVVLAPTGIAAVNVGGQTIHSFFKLPLKPLLPDDAEFAPSRLKGRMKYTNQFVKLLRKVELIIIDEVSMVRADIVDFIDKLLRHFCNNRREPFAGKQMLFVGDLFQLEPVVPPDMRLLLSRYYPNPYFFSAHAFKEASLVSVELTKVYRQDEPAFISLLDRLRGGSLCESDQQTLNTRVQAEDAAGATVKGSKKEKMVMTLATRRDIVEAINEERLEKIRKPLRTFMGEITGEFREQDLPTPLELRLKEGAQVVFIKNDYERRWVNGTLGRVTSCLPTQVEVTLEDGTVHSLEREKWANMKYEYDEKKKMVVEKEIGSYMQFPVKLAWALTIHKSQGLTFNNLVIDMGSGAFTPGQTYVALSRCRSLGGLVLRAPLRQSDVYVSSAIKDFARTFNDERAVAEAVKRQEREAALNRTLALWRSGNRTAAIDAFAELLVREPATVGADPLLMRFARIEGKRGLAKQAADGLRWRKERDEARRQLADLSREYVDLGALCLEGEDAGSAIANYDKALRLNPDNLHAMVGKAKALKHQGDEHGAAELLLKARDMAAKLKGAEGKRLLAAIDKALQ